MLAKTLFRKKLFLKKCEFKVKFIFYILNRKEKMLNNYVTIGLAIISLICIYLIWENFKQSAKIRYLEASIHETIQTVQGLVNNSLSLPPLPRNENHNYHPAQVNHSMSSAPNYNNNNNSNNNNNNNNSNKNNSSSVEARNTNIKKELFENDLESVTDEVENDVGILEPLELTNELKDKINNLVFIDGDESDNESNQEQSNIESNEESQEEMEDDLNNLEYDDEEKPSSPVEIEELEDLEDLTNEIQMENVNIQESKQESQEELKQESQEELNENIFDDHLSNLEEVKETQQESTTEDYIKNPELLNGMSLKQLKDIAEKYNLGVRGGKEQLLTKIKRNITML